jgi:hypothetical protein
MRKIFLILLLVLPILKGCEKENISTSQTATEIQKTIQKERPDIIISEVEIEEALRSNTQTSVCSWDFNFNGVIDSSDLLVVLSKFGDTYTINDLLIFLSVFGEEYIVDVIPAWTNFIQDNSFAVPSFSKIQCDGEIIIGTITGAPTIQFNETNWYYEGILVGSGDSLLIQTYDQNGEISNQGWQAPCDGDKLITLEIIHNNITYKRTAATKISTVNIPDSITICESLVPTDPFGFPICEEPGSIHFSGINNFCVFPPTMVEFSPYQFCTNCD